MKKPKRQKKAIAYRRVSTDEQGRSGIGLEGQQAAIATYAELDGYRIVGDYVDVASGRGVNNIQKRPGLRATIEHAVKAGIPIIVSGLDRLSREVSSIEQLIRENNLMIISADTGELSNPIVLASKAARAQKEGERISERTKQALQRKKAEGVILGNQTNLPEAQKKGLAARQRIASETVNKIISVLSELPETVTDRQLVEILNQRGIFSSRGRDWTIPAIRRPRQQAQAVLLRKKTEEDDLAEAYKNNPLFGRF